MSEEESLSSNCKQDTKIEEEKIICYDVVFKNEIDHEIRVSTGTYYESQVKDTGVFISIIGPTSEHGNYITKLEAQKIYEGLGIVLLKLNKK